MKITLIGGIPLVAMGFMFVVFATSGDLGAMVPVVLVGNPVLLILYVALLIIHSHLSAGNHAPEEAARGRQRLKFGMVVIMVGSLGIQAMVAAVLGEGMVIFAFWLVVSSPAFLVAWVAVVRFNPRGQAT